MPTCLITGANRGLGLEFARQYAADGWDVIATSRSLVYADDLKSIEGKVELHALDVTDFARVEALGQSLRDRPIDVLINNAGVHGDPTEAAFDDLDYRTWAEVMRINVMAPLKMSAVFVEQVAKSRQKRIATLSSKMGSMGENTSGGTYIYRSSKAALNAVMRSLALDLKSRGIALVILHPGWVRTDMGGPHGLLDPPESISGMRRVIAELNVENTGRFVNYDGSEVPW
ncbi:MAG: SDR family oxidoreductase [Rhodospirillales bacterium]|nr:SDR family oxidoreductase [Rhodospirillales bacterium]